MPLPAPYAPPWKRLGEDLVATLAWLGLKTRELWRRNGEGSLPVPGFWPRGGVRLFWPLAMGLVLVTVLALSRLWLWKPPVIIPAPLTEPVAPLVKGAESPQRESNLVAQPTGSSLMDQPTAPRAGQEPEAMGEPEEPSPAAAVPEPVEQQGQSQQPPPEPNANSEADGLLAQWSAEDPDHLLGAVQDMPASATLILRLNDRFFELASATRQSWAEHWQETASALGYGHIQLLDGQERLVGREALVGRGMVLLEAPQTPPLPPGAGGSAARDRQGEGSDGILRDPAGGTGGSLGSPPDALASKAGGLHRWFRR